MRVHLLAAAILVSGCSAASAGGAGQYERAIECELLTGTLAAFHPSISRKQIAEFQQGNAHFNRESERLGAAMNKSAIEIDGDRRAFIMELQKELTDSDADTVTTAKVKIAAACVAEVA